MTALTPIFAVFFLWMGLATPCGAQTASIEGDVYLLMRNGDTKKGAGLTVYLLRNAKSLTLAIDSMCAVFTPTLDSLKTVEDSVNDLWLDAAKRAAGNPDWTEVDELLERDLELLGEQTEYYEDTQTQLHALLLDNKIAETGTGMNAHYRFDNVAPDRYAVFAEWPLGRRTYQWWAPVVLDNDQQLTRDLDNQMEVSETFFCGIGT